jgi:hypothetical protein
MTLNEYDITSSLGDTDPGTNARAAAATLNNLCYWANCNSDGWPYWKAPSRASAALQRLLYKSLTESRNEGRQVDIPRAAYRSALVPIKTFKTKHNADFDIIPPITEPTNEIRIS